ncbi:RNase P modulator RnpM [Anaerovorax odorimutans]|uniref:RNase P modulator RnpM n=1 Tax=Anaerovorax odorimutans TaxID=109327 RepID=UPI000410A4A7|nr:YlxR family protein [Anaerovorax odorimutans]
MKTKKIPMRRCVGCMESKPKRELIRIVTYDGEVKLDATGKANGRGVYLCKSVDCFEKAKKRKSINRSLNIELNEEQLNLLFKELSQYEEKN